MDYSLMNPDHIKSELEDLETKLIPQITEEKAQMKARARQIIDCVKDSHNRGESSTLTHEQVAQLIGLLSDYDLQAFRFVRAYEFNVTVYKHLMKDRRWFVGSKLRFLKK